MILYVEYWRITDVVFKKLLHSKRDKYIVYSSQDVEVVKSDFDTSSDSVVNKLDISEQHSGDEAKTDNQENVQNDDMARNLMVLVGKAIDEWAFNYGMNNLPRHIVFKQALSIMNTWKDIFNL